MNVNTVILAGNLTRDPALRALPNGSFVCEFGLAINRTWNDKDGVKKQEVCFVEIVAWNKQAEACAEYLKKGSQALVEGRLKLDEWTDKDGGKRSKLRVTSDRVQFLNAKKSDKPLAEQMQEQEQPQGSDSSQAKSSDEPPF